MFGSHTLDCTAGSWAISALRFWSFGVMAGEFVGVSSNGVRSGPTFGRSVGCHVGSTPLVTRTCHSARVVLDQRMLSSLHKPGCARQ